MEGIFILWIVEKSGIQKYAWVSMYAPVNVMNRKGKETKFWNDVKDYLGKTEREKYGIIGRYEGRVGNREMVRIVGKWGVDGINKNGEHLMTGC